MKKQERTIAFLSLLALLTSCNGTTPSSPEGPTEQPASSTSSPSSQGGSSDGTSVAPDESSRVIASILDKYQDGFEVFTSAKVGSMNLDGTKGEVDQTLFTHTEQNRDFLAQEVLDSKKGNVVYPSSYYVEKKAYSGEDEDGNKVDLPYAAVYTSIAPDGTSKEVLGEANFPSSYPYIFDLIGENDFVVNLRENTATLFRVDDVHYVLGPLFGLQNVSLPLRDVVFRFDPEKLLFTSAEFLTSRFSQGSSSNGWIEAEAEFIEGGEGKVERYIPSIDGAQPDGLSDALAKTQEDLARGDFTLDVKTSALKGETSNKSYKAYADLPEGLFYNDLALYTEKDGYYREFLSKIGSDAWGGGYIPEESTLPPKSDANNFSQEEISSSFNGLSAKLFVATDEKTSEGEDLYALKDPRLLSNNSGILAAIKVLGDSYANYNQKHVNEFLLKAKEGKVTGWRVLSTRTSGDGVLDAFDYTFREVGTTAVPAEVATVAKRTLAFKKATNLDNYSNATLTIQDNLQKAWTKVVLNGTQAEVSTSSDGKSYSLVGYLRYPEGQGGYRPTELISQDAQGKWVVSKDSYFDTGTYSIVDGFLSDSSSPYRFPTQAEYDANGKLSEDWKTISVGAESTLSLDQEGLVTTYRKKVDGATSADFSATISEVGKSPKIEIPAVSPAA